MNDAAATKLLSELCFFFSFLSVFLYWRNDIILLLLIAVLCSVLTYFASKISNPLLRGLLSLLPFVSILLSKSISQTLGLLPAFIYTTFVCITGRFYLSYRSYKTEFTCSFILYFIFLCINMIGENYVANVSIIGMIFNISGLITLKRLRIGEGLDLRGKAISALEIVGPIIVILTIMLIGYEIIFNAAAVVEILLVPFAMLFYFASIIMVKVGNIFLGKAPEATELPEEVIEPEGTVIEQAAEQIKTTTNTIVKSLPAYFWQILLIIIFLAIVGYIVYRITQNFTKDNDEKIEFGKTEFFVREKKKKQTKEKVINDAQKVRKIYSDYLRYLKKNGIEINKGNTSQDILDKSEAIDKEQTAEKLRELYIKARYSNGKKITKEDVDSSENYLNVLTSSAK